MVWIVARKSRLARSSGSKLAEHECCKWHAAMIIAL